MREPVAACWGSIPTVERRLHGALHTKTGILFLKATFELNASDGK